jgi:hypothetical protein
MIDIFPGLVSSLKLQELVSVFALSTRELSMQSLAPQNEAGLLAPDQIVKLLMAVALQAGQKQDLSNLSLVVHVAETVHFSRLMGQFQSQQPTKRFTNMLQDIQAKFPGLFAVQPQQDSNESSDEATLSTLKYSLASVGHRAKSHRQKGIL